MKLYISADMEGSTGVVTEDQVDSSRPGYAFGRAMQLRDVLAVTSAALEWGVSSIVVNDAHWTMTNLEADKLGHNVELISGTSKMLGMTEGAEGCDAAFFLGYHAMAGTEKAVLDHTYCSKTIYALKINGKLTGETGFNAMICSALDVPVGLVSGDLALCFEASSLLGPELVTCPLKEGLGRHAARLLPPDVTSRILSEAAVSALDRARAGRCPKLVLKPSFEAEITFHTTAQTDVAALLPGSERISGRTLRFDTEDIFEVRRWLSSAMDAAGTV